MNEQTINSASELRRIIRELEKVAKNCEVRGSEEGAVDPDAVPSSASGGEVAYTDQVLAQKAAEIYATRRQRDRRLGERFFGEPAWDILLDLFVHYQQEKPVSVTSACLASASPPTTGQRWLGVLEQAGFIERLPDPDDGRVTLVRLTENGLEVLREILGNYVAKVHDVKSAD